MAVSGSLYHDQSTENTPPQIALSVTGFSNSSKTNRFRTPLCCLATPTRPGCPIFVVTMSPLTSLLLVPEASVSSLPEVRSALHRHMGTDRPGPRSDTTESLQISLPLHHPFNTLKDSSAATLR